MQADFTRDHVHHLVVVFLQVDDAVLANMYDTLVSQSPERYREWAELRVEALNHALRGIPREKIRLHVCWGNYEGPHTHDIAIGKIMPIVLKAKPMALLLLQQDATVSICHSRTPNMAEITRQADILVASDASTQTLTREHLRLAFDRIQGPNATHTNPYA